jgi:Fur family zinc uptake transcriptional regulator
MKVKSKQTAAPDAVKQAEDYCKANALQFTAPRRAVLKIIAASKKPLGAYEILEKLGKHLDNPKPPTAYRALEFLQTHGLIHRIESLNAYLACHAGHRHSGSQFMICTACDAVIEAHICSLPESLQKKLVETSFNATYWSAEIHGLCAGCQKKRLKF